MWANPKMKEGGRTWQDNEGQGRLVLFHNWNLGEFIHMCAYIHTYTSGTGKQDCMGQEEDKVPSEEGVEERTLLGKQQVVPIIQT